jgi:hypothetical protein
VYHAARPQAVGRPETGPARSPRGRLQAGLPELRAPSGHRLPGPGRWEPAGNAQVRLSLVLPEADRPLVTGWSEKRHGPTVCPRRPAPPYSGNGTGRRLR